MVNRRNEHKDVKDKRKIRFEEKRYERKSIIQIIMNLKLLFSKQSSTSVMGYGKGHVGLKLFSFRSKS